jgi:hypothetical protein
MADFPAEIFAPPNPIRGEEDTHRAELFRTNPLAPAIHYKLRAFRTSDSTWQQWDDTVVSLANAPGGAANYAGGAGQIYIEGSSDAA